MKKRIIPVICISIILILIFSIVSSATYIGGKNYNVLKNFNETITTTYTVNYQYIIFTTMNNISLNDNYSDNKDNIVKLIFNMLEVDILTSTYDHTQFKDCVNKFYNGDYLFSDLNIVGPISQKEYLRKFNANINQTIQYQKNIYYDKLSSLYLQNEVIQSLFFYNNTFKMIFLDNLRWFMEELATYQFIQVDNIYNLIYDSPLNIPDNDTISVNDTLLYNGFGIVTNKDDIYKLVYPINTMYDFNSAIEYLKDSTTWSFLPVQIFGIVVQFIAFMISVGLMFKIFKTLRG